MTRSPSPLNSRVNVIIASIAGIMGVLLLAPHQEVVRDRAAPALAPA